MRTRHLQWISAESAGGAAVAEGVADFATEIAAGSTVTQWPASDPRLAPRDEVIFLLHTAAEVEHALLVQYLYAGWSIPDAHEEWRSNIMNIARQEMGHLITVQNILRALGGPLNFEREDYPFRSDFYPFRFKLEPLSISSLAKYVIAEMPEDPGLQPGELDIIKFYAKIGEAQATLNRVGALYAHLRFLIATAIPEEDFMRPDSAPFQGGFDEWLGVLVTDMIIEKIDSKAAALKALCKIAAQGEGMDACPESTLTGEPHFRTFLSIYRERLRENDPRPVSAIPTNPNTDSTTHPEPEIENGRITHSVSRALAQLFNLRYWRLLTYLSHTLHLGSDTDAANHKTLRPELRTETFTEMGNLGRITSMLTRLPQQAGHEAGPPFAGPPFELPYSLALPDLEIDRWLLHRDQIGATGMLIEKIEQDGLGGISAALKDGITQLLTDLKAADQAILEMVTTRIAELRPA